MLDIVNLNHDRLRIPAWQVASNEKVVVIGKNGAGKQYLDLLLSGELEQFSADKLQLPAPKQVALVSFETLQKVYEHELAIDETDITNVVDDGTPARDFLPPQHWQHPLIEQFELSHRLDTGYRLLSTGESRKLLILQAVLEHIDDDEPMLLVCDNPFDSLDTASTEQLTQVLGELSEFQITVILSLSNRQDIPSWCEKIAILDKGLLLELAHYHSAETKRHIEALMTDESLDTELPEPLIVRADTDLDSPLVKLVNGRIAYHTKLVFEDLDLTIMPGQHTLVTGKNGCGKSSLLQLITGDHPQCYVNDLHVLGFQRGNGESIWQIKQKMGIVSPEIHRQYRVSCSVLSVVISGFFDSIGVYTQATSEQISHAQQWLDKVGLGDYSAMMFGDLSYGEQRIVLILRALVKAPVLLVMDEATQGLDEVNRRRVMHFLQRLDGLQQTTILYVSHRQDEYLPLFQQHIKM